MNDASGFLMNVVQFSIHKVDFHVVALNFILPRKEGGF